MKGLHQLREEIRNIFAHVIQHLLHISLKATVNVHAYIIHVSHLYLHTLYIHYMSIETYVSRFYMYVGLEVL